MPDHREMGREPTEREREVVFAPNESPKRQADGDPGIKVPRLDPQGDEPAEEKKITRTKPEEQADGVA
jgi:hypothetical protein